MKGKSILLALNGSRQSHFASEVCWNLARKLGAKITAQHVVDSHSAWEFLGHDRPGFLDSQKYLDAYQDLVSNLFVLGEGLAIQYAKEAKALGIDDVCIVDEGNPIREICKRSIYHKMVVIGHRPSEQISNAQHEQFKNPHEWHDQTPGHSQFHRISVAEALAHDCPRPLLVVQGECNEWTSMSIMISLDHINEIFINSCLDMASALGLKPALLCLTGGVHEEAPEKIVADLRSSNERLKTLPIAMVPAKKEISVSVEQWYPADEQPFQKELFDNPLMVIPTRLVAGSRLTVVDSSPALFIRYLTLPTILLWPEEFVYPVSSPIEEKQTRLAPV